MCLIHTHPLFIANPPLTRLNLHTQTHTPSRILQRPEQTDTRFPQPRLGSQRPKPPGPAVTPAAGAGGGGDVSSLHVVF